MSISVEPIKPLIGGVVHIDKSRLCDDDVVQAVHQALADRGVLVFPEINLTDEEQLAFTDRLGDRVNFTRRVPGSDTTAQDIYQVTLDSKVNREKEYVLGSFFWHVDAASMDMPMPKTTMLSARKLASEGGTTEFANLYAAYEMLPAAEKKPLEGMRAVHTLEASLRSIYPRPSAEKLERWKGLTGGMDQPIVWEHDDGRKSLLVGTHADGVVGMPGPHGRSIMIRLLQWASQPDFVYRHEWKVGDLALWDNYGMMHRVTPYTDEGRSMHRTTISGTERPGRPLPDAYHTQTEPQMA